VNQRVVEAASPQGVTFVELETVGWRDRPTGYGYSKPAGRSLKIKLTLPGPPRVVLLVVHGLV
jgi:hypothetical protein